MSGDVWLVETYFDWLRKEAFHEVADQRIYEGCLRLIHDIPFYWTIWSDENRAGDALTFRQYEFLGFQDDLESLDQVWLGQWATATPSTLEVLLGMSRRWAYYFGGEVHVYFNHMFKNLGLDRFPGRVLSTRSNEVVRTIVDDWLSRQFTHNGGGSPFPMDHMQVLDIVDMRKLDIWSQMNAYSAEHFQ